MIESIVFSLLGIVLIAVPVIPAFLIGFYTSLTFNVLFLYILKRFLFPKAIYSNHFFKKYFLGTLLIVIAFEAIGFLIIPYDAHIHFFADNKEDINNILELEIFYHHFGSFNSIFLGLMPLKTLLFYISWRIQGFTFKEQYKAYRIKDFVLPKPKNQEKYIGLCLGIFFTLSNFDMLPFMINLGERNAYTFLQTYRTSLSIFFSRLIETARIK